MPEIPNHFAKNLVDLSTSFRLLSQDRLLSSKYNQVINKIKLEEEEGRGRRTYYNLLTQLNLTSTKTNIYIVFPGSSLFLISLSLMPPPLKTLTLH